MTLQLNRFSADRPADRVGRTFVRLTCDTRNITDGGFTPTAPAPFALSEFQLCYDSKIVVDNLVGINSNSDSLISLRNLVDQNPSSSWDERNALGVLVPGSDGSPYIELVYAVPDITYQGCYIKPHPTLPLPNAWSIKKIGQNDASYVQCVNSTVITSAALLANRSKYTVAIGTVLSSCDELMFHPVIMSSNQYSAEGVPADRIGRTFFRFTANVRAPLDYSGNHFLVDGNISIPGAPFSVASATLCNADGIPLSNLVGVSAPVNSVANATAIVDNQQSTEWSELDSAGHLLHPNPAYFDLVYSGNVDLVGYYLKPSAQYPLPLAWVVQRRNETDTDWVQVDNPINVGSRIPANQYALCMMSSQVASQSVPTAVDYVGIQPVVQTGPWQPPDNIADGGGVTGFAVSSLLLGNVTLTWSDTHVNTYLLERAVEDGPFEVISNTSTSRSASFKVLTPGTTYTFRVQRLNAIPTDHAICVVTMPGNAPTVIPSMPLKLSVVAMSTTQLRVRFAYVGADEDWFDIERTDPDMVEGQSSLPTTVITVGSNTTTWYDNNKVQGKIYKYRVRARNKIGASTWTTQVDGTPLTPAQVTQNALIVKMESGVPLSLQEACTTVTSDPTLATKAAAVLSSGGLYNELRAIGLNRTMSTALALIFQTAKTAADYSTLRFQQVMDKIKADPTLSSEFVLAVRGDVHQTVDQLLADANTPAERTQIVNWAIQQHLLPS